MSQRSDVLNTIENKYSDAQYYIDKGNNETNPVERNAYYDKAREIAKSLHEYTEEGYLSLLAEIDANERENA